MVVKKFEARSMKEALEMVKAEMGPEAIIIAARDNSKRYGLVGEGSVEITAAIQQASLQKKMTAEAKIPAQIREKIHRGSAKAHRELIEKSLARIEMPPAVAKAPIAQKPNRPVERQQRYIDMHDDVEPAAAPNGANEKLKMAAQKAWKAMQVERQNNDGIQIESLKSEINSLREIFKNIKEVPQTIVQAHPGAEFGLSYDLASTFEKLQRVGLETPIIVEILKQVQERLPANAQKNAPLVQGLVAQALAKRIEICKEQSDSKVEVFMGAGGHGKTSTLIKCAANLVLNEQKRIAILTTDTQKFGAGEQLKIYAQILNIPFMVISDYSQWEVLAQEAGSFDKILIDTPGVRFRIADEMQKLKQLLPPAYLHAQTHLVISATSKDQDAIELAKRFATVGFDDVVFTALDESCQHGVLLNFQAAIGKPFHSFGIGPRVPEDYERATKERILDLLLGHNSESQISLNMNL